jgi:thiaminase
MILVGCLSQTMKYYLSEKEQYLNTYAYFLLTLTFKGPPFKSLFNLRSLFEKRFPRTQILTNRYTFRINVTYPLKLNAGVMGPLYNPKKIRSIRIEIYYKET